MTPWPALPPEARWRDTRDLMHRTLQMIGKHRLAHTPWLNHSWHATLHVTPRGLTTGSVHQRSGGCVVIDVDLRAMRVRAAADDGALAEFALGPMSVAEAHRRTTDMLRAVGADPMIHPRPSELPDATPFADDDRPRDWDAEAVRAWHDALLRIGPVAERFRTGFVGKSSPVHLFWGALDLAVTRFSGRAAPPHPGGIPNLPDAVTREAYSHEVASAGFWPGGDGQEAAFYAYAYPTPEGFAAADVPGTWSEDLGEFLLPYAEVRGAADPAARLLAFWEAAYAAAARLGDWPDLARPYGRVGAP